MCMKDERTTRDQWHARVPKSESCSQESTCDEEQQSHEYNCHTSPRHGVTVSEACGEERASTHALLREPDLPISPHISPHLASQRAAPRRAGRGWKCLGSVSEVSRKCLGSV